MKSLPPVWVGPFPSIVKLSFEMRGDESEGWAKTRHNILAFFFSSRPELASVVVVSRRPTGVFLRVEALIVSQDESWKGEIPADTSETIQVQRS